MTNEQLAFEKIVTNIEGYINTLDDTASKYKESKKFFLALDNKLIKEAGLEKSDIHFNAVYLPNFVK